MRRFVCGKKGKKPCILLYLVLICCHRKSYMQSLPPLPSGMEITVCPSYQYVPIANVYETTWSQKSKTVHIHTRHYQVGADCNTDGYSGSRNASVIPPLPSCPTNLVSLGRFSLPCWSLRQFVNQTKLSVICSTTRHLLTCPSRQDIITRVTTRK